MIDAKTKHSIVSSNFCLGKNTNKQTNKQTIEYQTTSNESISPSHKTHFWTGPI